MGKLQDAHEAYQVIVKVLKAKNLFIKKAKQKVEINKTEAAIASVVGKKKVQFH
jgi:hypothetical protein